jgi:hypothetical protein
MFADSFPMSAGLFPMSAGLFSKSGESFQLLAFSVVLREGRKVWAARQRPPCHIYIGRAKLPFCPI